MTWLADELAAQKKKEKDYKEFASLCREAIKSPVARNTVAERIRAGSRFLYSDMSKLLGKMCREEAFLEADTSVLAALCQERLLKGIMQSDIAQHFVHRCIDYGLFEMLLRVIGRCAVNEIDNDEIDYNGDLCAYCDVYNFDLSNGISAQSAQLAVRVFGRIKIRAKDDAGDGLLEWLEVLRNDHPAFDFDSFEGAYALPECKEKPQNKHDIYTDQSKIETFAMCKIFEACALAGFSVRFPKTTAFSFVQLCFFTRSEIADFVGKAKAEVALFEEYCASASHLQNAGMELLKNLEKFTTQSIRIKNIAKPSANALERTITAGKTACERAGATCTKLKLHLDHFANVLGPGLSDQVAALQHSALRTIGKTLPPYVALDIFDFTDHLAYGRFNESELINLINAATQRATYTVAAERRKRKRPSLEMDANELDL